MKKLFLIRHGESFSNEAGTLTGWIDTPLTAKGIEESIRLGKQIATTRFDIIFSSQLSRAIQTALLISAFNNFSQIPVIIHSKRDVHSENYNNINGFIAQNKIPIILSPLLNERFYGTLQGELIKNITINKESESSLWDISFGNYAQAEELSKLKTRTLRFINNLLVPSFYNCSNILIVAHGTLLRIMLSIFDSLAFEEAKKIKIDNCSVIEYTFTDSDFKKA